MENGFGEGVGYDLIRLINIRKKEGIRDDFGFPRPRGERGGGGV